MRRIYLESIVGLISCFILSLFLYEVTVYQLNTDYDYVLDDYEAQAYQELVDNIAINQGLEAAHEAMDKFVATSRSKVTAFSSNDALPDNVANYFAEYADKMVYHDEERLLWFRLTDSSKTYLYEPDEQSFVRQKIELESNLIWGFFLFGFLLYGFGHLFIIFRRVKRLEQATLRFSEGDFSARADISGGKTIGSMGQTFNLMAERISQLIDSNRSLTNAVAHELRTPVFRIQWQAEMLKDSALDSEQNTKVDSIIEDTEEMEQMVDELLHFARFERGKMDLELETVQLDDYLNQAIKRWGKESDLKIDSRVHRADSQQTFLLNADKKLLGRALDNLVRNALKFAESKVLIETKAGKDVVSISVHDDGPGVSIEHRSHLFDPFYIADKARSKAKSGHGLGLSIVDKICEQHNASIEVSDSEHLGGALFKISFPVCNEPADKSLR
ncbi:ATP-binding protein [Vibrio sp. 10N.261.55.A7]|uniref:sensor histidine kinase n=1 Tax=Vibrio sp. 10N.261.55.A7 TaxID=1880851 RepID=UPI000C827776|nr:ATP-binding protein [Vibrio sp. 10N.261.55.A7]PMJ91705.1 two-component sensor histidine kinase [Vibrio sp. 10N.261.55.A7]